MIDVWKVGNATRDPELRYTPNGVGVAEFNIAENLKDKNGNESTEFHRCVAFNKLAENVTETVKKGTRVIVVGRASNKPWEDKEGNKRTSYKILASFVGPDLNWATASIVKNSKSDKGTNADF